MKKLFALLLCGLFLVGCGSEAADLQEEAAALREEAEEANVYQTPDGYTTYTLNGYDIDYPEEWIFMTEGNGVPGIVLQPYENERNLVTIKIDSPEGFEVDPTANDDSVLEEINTTYIRDSLTKTVGISSEPMDGHYGRHFVLSVGVDQGITMYVCSSFVDGMILQVIALCENDDTAISTASMNIIDSARKSA